MFSNYFKIFVCIFLISGFETVYANDGSAMFDGENSRFFIGDYFEPINPEANRQVLQISGTTITLEAWIYLVDLPAAGEKQVIASRNFYNSSDASIFSSYELRVSNISPNTFPKIEFYLSGIGGVEGIVGSSIAPVIGEWIHVAGTYDGANMKLYLNGNQDNSEPFSASINPWSEIYNALFYIGANYSQTNLFYGFIDEVRLWGITRSASDITQYMNWTIAPEEDGLLGYWQLNTEEGDYPIDLTSNHNDLDSRLPFFTYFDHNSIPGTPANLNIIMESIDFGKSEVGATKYIHFELTNTGDQPCFGTFFSPSTDVTIASYRYLIAPQSYFGTIIKAIPQVIGVLQGDILFNEGNAVNLPQSVPFQIESVNLEGFDANSIGMWMLNHGYFALNPLNNQGGFYWPLAEKKSAVYASGIWVGAEVNGEKRTSVCYHNSEFKPGPIINGVAGDPSDPKYRLYKINKGDDSSNPDYAQWPDDLGAPINQDETPAIIGDQTLFMVYNDLDPAAHFPSYGETPLGVEIQQTVFGFKDSGVLSNTVFLRFKILNKSNDVWEDTYVSLWSDPDLGFAYDDLIGIDTIRTLGYCYNGNPTDDVYGSDIPAVGYDILKGAFYAKPIQAFAYYTNGSDFPFGDPSSVEEAYNFMSGKLADGTNYTDPTTNKSTKYALNGDPVTQTGWTDNNPDDRRFLFSTGPFTLEPNQGKEIIAAIIVSRGSDYLDSITELRMASDEIQALYDNGEIFGGELENVTTEQLEPNETTTINDIVNSGAELYVTAGDEGATVEVATFVEPPSGAEEIEGSAVHGVGNYLDIQVDGDIEYPMQVNMYYTQNDLDQAGVGENEIEGIYYWSAAQNEWILYSNSGLDDQGRGPSTTGVSIDNLQIDGINYEGKVWADAFHLTPMRIGTVLDSSLMSIETPEISPHKFNVFQNYPNPFNPFTTLEFDIPKYSFVSIKLFNVSGQFIKHIFSGQKSQGKHKIKFDGRELSSGIYIYHVQAGEYLKTKKMILIK